MVRGRGGLGDECSPLIFTPLKAVGKNGGRQGIMECSNCGEVLESGCSVSAGLRQEDRLILDWERRHKGRSCSGALRPFGKLKEGLFIHLSVPETALCTNHLLAY